MKLRAGLPFSLIKYGLPFDYPKLEKDLHTDVLVMGGGISGALTAYYLIKRGINCSVIDGRSIGLGSTSASTSLLQYEIDTALHELIDMVGEKNAVRSYRLCIRSIIELEKIAKEIGLTDFTPKESLYYAATKKDIPFLEKEFLAREKYKFPVQWLDQKKILEEFGFEAPAGILSSVAATTDAYLFTHYLLQYCISKGLKVYDRSPVVSIKHSSRAVELKTSNGHSIKAKKLVYATGYEVVNYIKEPIVKLHSTYAIISESFSTKQQFKKHDALIWNTAEPYLYMRTTPDNRFIIGGRDEQFFSPGKRDKLINAKSRQLRNDFKKLFPVIPFNTEFSWTGTFGSTKDGLPYIGPYKKLPNSYFALGFGGNGITFSQVAGEIIADLLRGNKNKDVEIFSFER